jgi:hypothetical protein
MPLIRIESRKKAADGAPAPSPGKPPRADAQRGGSGPAILAGALVGLLVIGAISAYVITQRPQPAAPAPVVIPAGAEALPTVVPLQGVAPLNLDYPREATLAYVNGVPYTMLQLELATRVAKTLASISKDPAPDYGAPEMRDFQITMLRRELDGLILRQAMVRDGLQAPAGDVTPAVDGFLKQFQATPEQLSAALAANGITRADLDSWFGESRETQFYIQTKLMPGHQPEEQAEVVRAWLNERFEAQVTIADFYEPSATVAPAATPGAP